MNRDDEVLGEYVGWLHTVAGNLLGWSSPDLPDLVQEGYIAMWRALGDFDPAKGELDYWLKFKARWKMKSLVTGGHGHHYGHYYDHIASQPAAVDGEEPEDPLDLLAAPDLLDGVEVAYHHGEIAEAISSLSPAQRRYVVARFWVGLSGKEMRELGVFSYDPSALWNSRKNGARWKLAQRLQHMAMR